MVGLFQIFYKGLHASHPVTGESLSQSMHQPSDKVC